MKKLLSSILALTLFFNSTVGYCENADMNGQLLVSAEIEESAQSNDNRSDADATPSNIKFEIATKFHKLVPYLKEKRKQCKTFINKKIKEQKSNSITEKQKEFQDLQSMSTSQYIEHCIKKFGVAALKILALFWVVAFPGFIIGLNKGYKEGQLKGEKSGEKIINDAIERAKKIWAPEDPLLLKTHEFLNSFTYTFDENSNSSVLDAFVANAQQLLDELYNRCNQK